MQNNLLNENSRFKTLEKDFGLINNKRKENMIKLSSKTHLYFITKMQRKLMFNECLYIW